MTTAAVEPTPTGAVPLGAPSEAPVEPEATTDGTTDAAPAEPTTDTVPVEPATDTRDAEPIDEAPTAAPARPKPSAVPTPGPRRPAPRPPAQRLTPAAPVIPATPASASDGSEWGRVDESGAVYVRDGDSERRVGEYPDGTPAEALAYFERKFADLAAQVVLLEQRAAGGAPPADIARAVKRIAAALDDANAVGDLAGLRERVAALTGAVSELTAQQSEAHKAEVAASRAEREAIVVEAEALAARDPATVQWKATTVTMDALFARWQESQKSSARVPKGEANELWRRFRAARATIDTARRAFFTELDSSQKTAREAKEALITRAEALAGSTNDPIGVYRGLLEEWKAVPRVGRKADDALWARFRAAGDTVYEAKSAAVAVENEEFTGNLAAKNALIEEAEPLLTAKDAAAARATLTSIQRRWDAIGKVPREQMKAIEDRLRRIEQSVKNLEQEHWTRSNPETKARSEGLAAQLNTAIERLERDLAAAREKGDARAIKDAEDALAARRIWLDAINS